MIRRLAAFSLIVAIVFSSSIGRSMAQTSFTIITSTWGTSSPVEAEPGDQNIPLTLTMQYTDSVAIGRLTVTLYPPSGFADSNGASHPKAYTAGLQSNAIFQLSFNLNIASDVQVGTCTFTAQFTWTRVDNTTGEEWIDTTIHLNGRANLVFQPDEIALDPGQANNISLRLKNNGSGDATKISVTISPPPQASILSEMPSTFALSAGQTKEIAVTLFVPATSAGSALTFVASSTYKDAYFYPRSITQSFGLLISSKALSSLKVSPSTTLLKANSLNNLSIQIGNEGNSPANNMSVTTSIQGSQVSLIGSNLIQISRIAPSENASIDLTIFVGNLATTSTATLTLIATYLDGSNLQRTESRAFGLSIDVEPTSSPFSISIEPNTITAGTVNNLTLTLSNQGKATMQTISASFSFPGGQVTLLTPDISQTASIAGGESTKIAIRAFAPTTTASSALLQVSLKYYDDKEVFTQETRTVGLLYRGIIDLELVDFSVIPQSPSTGQIFSVTATITNTGTITASAVTATPNLTSAFKIFGSRSIFIGDVQANTQTTFTLSLQVDNRTAPGSYSIGVGLSFSDNLRNDLSVREVIPVTVSQAAQQQPTQDTQHPVLARLQQSGPYIAVGAAMLGVGFLLGKRSRRK